MKPPNSSMTRKLLDLSQKIDEFMVQVVEAIDNVATNLNIPFFVVGATARDVILKYSYDINTIRATIDIDLAVRVPDWEQYDMLRRDLIMTGMFENDNRVPQRILYQGSYPVDIVPFGKVQDQNGHISWPPEHEIKLNALGFEESFNDSILVRLRSDPPLDVRFASLVGQAVLKLISWKDDYPNRAKDAHDLLWIMLRYIDSGNQERLFGEESDLLEKDFELASARLLGRDIGKMIDTRLEKEIINILEEETKEEGQFRLIIDMISGNIPRYYEFDSILPVVGELKTGILENT